MYTSDPLQPDGCKLFVLLSLLYVKKLSNFICYCYLFILFLFIILIFFLLTTKVNNANALKLKCSLIFLSGRKAILSYERYAYFDSN